MSTVKAVNFQHPSSSAANLTLAADGTVTGGLPAGGRNLLYNGAMQVAQRGTSTASITTGGYYTADRWQMIVSSLGTWTQSVENDAPTGSGLRKSLKMLCTTADASPAAGDYLFLRQQLEGQDLQRIAKGTASAQQLTISFWVKANVTGTYAVNLVDDDNSRMVAASYTISASATWEKKTITFPADTTGAFDNDNASSLSVWLFMGAGTNYTSGSLATTWASVSDANRAVGQTNVAAATNNYWQVTGVQLEVGPVASAFEFKSFGQELRECQRYYQRFTGSNSYDVFHQGQATGSTTFEGWIGFYQPMRTNPSAIETTGTASNYAVVNSTGGVLAASAVPSLLRASTYAATIQASVASGLTAGQSSALLNNNVASAYLGFSAEL